MAQFIEANGMVFNVCQIIKFNKSTHQKSNEILGDQGNVFNIEFKTSNQQYTTVSYDREETRDRVWKDLFARLCNGDKYIAL